MPAASHTKAGRLTRRIMLSVGVLILLLAGYLGSYLAAVWGMSNGYERVVGPISSRIYPVWQPIDLYCAYDLPLSRSFDRFAWWFRSGGRLTWSDASAKADALHEERIQRRLQRK